MDDVTPSCGLEACSSPCHRPGVGRYCAPTRCYCGGCPGHVPVERGSGPVTEEQLEGRRLEALETFRAARRQL